MKIMICGSWRKENAEKYRDDLVLAGREIAIRGHILHSGAGMGISKIVVESYKNNSGQKYIAYLVNKKEMEKVGEEIGPEPDEIIETNLDYPQRNIELVKSCEGAIIFPGSLGTLTETIHAAIDYSKKVVVFDKGNVAEWVKMIPKLRKRIFLTDSIKEALDYLEKKV